MPCQWTEVGTFSSLITLTRRVSPSLTRISGPGTWPSYPQMARSRPSGAARKPDTRNVYDLASPPGDADMASGQPIVERRKASAIIVLARRGPLLRVVGWA